jgi:AcrR family transcriptional regulator
MSASATARARVRAELVQEIKDAARRQMAAEGASALSLRAVARELGMCSSNIYRYFPSRDQLLTALIVDAYDAVGEAAEVADARCERDDFAGRWSAACHSIRDWAGSNPHEYALVYGSPVPGYRAPEDTIAPATRVTLVLISLIVDATAAGAVKAPVPAAGDVPISPTARAEAERLTEGPMTGVDVDTVIRSLVAWTQLFGFISFELFGHLVGAVEKGDAIFDAAVEQMGAFVGLGARSVGRTNREGATRGRERDARRTVRA